MPWARPYNRFCVVLTQPLQTSNANLAVLQRQRLLKIPNLRFGQVSSGQIVKLVLPDNEGSEGVVRDGNGGRGGRGGQDNVSNNGCEDGYPDSLETAPVRVGDVCAEQRNDADPEVVKPVEACWPIPSAPGWTSTALGSKARPVEVPEFGFGMKLTKT